RSENRYLRQRCLRVENFDVFACRDGVCDGLACLGDVRRTGRVRDDTAGSGRVETAVQQTPLQPGQPSDVRRLPAPPGIWSSAQRAESGARSIKQDAAESIGAVGRAGAIGTKDAADSTDYLRN